MEVLFPLILIGLLAFAIFVAFRAVTAARKESIDTLERELRVLSRRIETIERERPEVRGAERVVPPVPTGAPDAGSPTSSTAPAPPPAPSLTPAPRPSPPPRRPLDLEASFETFLGGRVLLVAGVIVLLFGLAFFLKYAIDHGWIGPGARIVMGVVWGVLLLAGGDRLRRRGFDHFGQALMGCGLGALYLSNYFACMRYAFIGTTAAFVLTACLTALGATLALLRRAPLLAWLGFVGGYLAPALLSPRAGELVALTRWLLLIDAGVVVVLLRRAWRGLDVLALFFAWFYVSLWLVKHHGGSEVGALSACVAALVAASLVMGLVPAIVRRVAPPEESLFGVAMAGLLGAIAGHDLLFPDHRFGLAGGAATLAATYLAASRLVAKRTPAARTAEESFLGFAAGALALAVAVATSGVVVAPALSITGVALVFAGSRTRHPILLASGIGTILVAFGDLLFHRLPLFDVTATPFLNERFLVFASPCAALLVAGWLLSRITELPASVGTAIATFGLVALPIVLAADFTTAIAPLDDRHRELRLVAPALALAAYGLVAARLFGRFFALGRTIAMAPIAGALLFGVALLADGHREPCGLFFNPTFAAGLALVASAGLAASSADAGPRAALRTLALVYLFGLVTAEIDAWGRTCPIGDGSREEARFRASVWISIAWALDASALVALGFLRRSAPLRWMGLATFAATLCKVFLVDMAELAAVYRIGSFLVLGALLLGASFLYQRAKRADDATTRRV